MNLRTLLLFFGLSATARAGQYGETFQTLPAGASVLPAATGELFSNQLATTAKIAEEDLRELQLTADGTGYTRTAFRLPDLDPGTAISAFSAKWNSQIFGDTNAGVADGFSFNFGPLGGITATAFTDGTYNHENGFNSGLTVSVRTFTEASPGYYVRVNGNMVANGFVPKATAAWGHRDSTRHFFEVDWTQSGGLTLLVDRRVIFSWLPTPGYTPAAGDRFVFGARTGGYTGDVRLDNIVILTGGVLSLPNATGPLHYSGENPPSETAAKAFDLDVNTKWLTFASTGSLGSGFATPRTVRAYTLTSANDYWGRNPKSWAFQTGDNGSDWTSRGTQSEQHFRGYHEQRAFLVTSPAAGARFRVDITANRLDPETQLAEFQTYELLPSSPHTVTSTGDAGVGTLRQALADAAATPGPGVINFSAALNGWEIAPASTLVVNDPAGVTIDASSLAAGITISGGGARRLFVNQNGSRLTIHRVTLVNGRPPSENGGAVFNQGTLEVTDCAFSGHWAVNGAALFNLSGATSVRGCTFLDNAAVLAGGAVGTNGGTLALTNCTFSGNTAELGGAVSLWFTTTTMTHCTLSGNAASLDGGGIRIVGNPLTLTNCIVAGNTGPATSEDIFRGTATLTPAGVNLIGNPAGSGLTAGPGLLTGDARLAPPGNYGGPTRTMPPLPDSPALDAASAVAGHSQDQRGATLPASGRDIGAVELGQIVVTTAADENNGIGTGGVSLREAVTHNTPFAAELIRFAPALNGQTITLTTQIELAKPVAFVDASALPDGLTIHGGDGTRLFNVIYMRNLALYGITLTHGFRSDSGGAVQMGRGNLIAVRCTFSENRTLAEGGAISTSGISVVEQCVFSKNQAIAGGAIDVDDDGDDYATVTLKDSIFSENSARGGGAVHFSGRSGAIDRCTFSENSAASGGAIGNGGLLTIERCTFSNNTASESGGAISSGWILTLRLCTLSGNSATEDGGAIVSGESLLMSHCTLSGNSAASGGGLYSRENDGPHRLTNSLVAGNMATTGPDIYYTAATISLTGVNFIGNLTGSRLTPRPGLLTGDARLAPLGDYGGPTQTMPPLPTSPALDATVSLPGDEQDQRGAPVPATGRDIGAVELGQIVVTTAADENNGIGTGSVSLREAVTHNTPFAAELIRFAPALNGQTIPLTTQINVTKPVAFVDASALASGLAINGGNVTRIFEVNSGRNLALHGLTLTGGKGDFGGAILAQSGTTLLERCVFSENHSNWAGKGVGGGAIYVGGGLLSVKDCILTGNSTEGYGGAALVVDATITIQRCTFSGNTAEYYGGAILAAAVFAPDNRVLLEHCTFSGNFSAQDGGAIYNVGEASELTLNHCTLSGNSATRTGGGIFNEGDLTLSHCTLSGNAAAVAGGGLASPGPPAVNALANCIVAGNLGGSTPDFHITLTALSPTGVNLIGNLSGSGLTAGPGILTGDARLAPLANYGGPTATMALRPESPARNAATGSTITGDQRGFPMVGVPDIGAYEAGTTAAVSCAAWFAETAPNTAPALLVGPLGDYDGDGTLNEMECLAGTDPLNRATYFRITDAVRIGNNLRLTFPTVTGRNYTLWHAGSLAGPWTNTGLSPLAGNNSFRDFTVPAPVAGVPRRFFRVQTGP